MDPSSFRTARLANTPSVAEPCVCQEGVKVVGLPVHAHVRRQWDCIHSGCIEPSVLARVWVCLADAGLCQSRTRKEASIVLTSTVLWDMLLAAGKAVVHTYTAGNEPYEVWEGLERGSKEYEDLKQQRAETLWKVCYQSQFLM